jgi:hypothetical protein
VTLSTTRTRAYGFGALTGAFAAVALVAAREGRGGTRAAVAASLACGALAVAFEERAQREERPNGRRGRIHGPSGSGTDARG